MPVTEDPKESPRKSWTTPTLNRIRTNEAENGLINAPDATNIGS